LATAIVFSIFSIFQTTAIERKNIIKTLFSKRKCDRKDKALESMMGSAAN